MGVNSKKIAFTKADGTTELYAEIERWDNATEEAWIWVSRDGWSITSGADTEFYIYYDNSHADNNTFIGDTNSAVATNVWDNSFKAVYHMRDKDANEIYDSTSNNNDGTKTANNEPIEVVGKIDKAQHFDGANDKVDCGADGSVKVTAVTVEAWINIDVLPTACKGLVGRWEYTNNDRCYALFIAPDNKIHMGISSNGAWGAADRDNVYDNVVPSTTTWYHYAGTYNGDCKIYRNGIDATTVLYNGTNANINLGSVQLDIGCHRSNGNPTRHFDGLIDEVRVSSIARVIAWVKATYESGADTLISWMACPCEGVPATPSDVRACCECV